MSINRYFILSWLPPCYWFYHTCFWYPLVNLESHRWYTLHVFIFWSLWGILLFIKALILAASGHFHFIHYIILTSYFVAWRASLINWNFKFSIQHRLVVLSDIQSPTLFILSSEMSRSLGCTHEIQVGRFSVVKVVVWCLFVDLVNWEVTILIWIILNLWRLY